MFNSLYLYMDQDLERKIRRAKELLATARHAAIATVNEDGSPHNSPLRIIFDPKLENIYWGSHPESVHSVNITRTGKIFVVLYDLIQRGGLYIKAEDAHVLSGEELEKALFLHNRKRTEEGSEPLTLDYYRGDSPQRMWSARITNFWVNTSEKDANGHVARDGRQEITVKDLVN